MLLVSMPSFERGSQRERPHGLQGKKRIASFKTLGSVAVDLLTCNTRIGEEGHHGSDPIAGSFLGCSSMLLGSVSGSEEAGQLRVRTL